MTDLAVRCDYCAAFSRVPAMAIGKFAVCPACRREFLIKAPAPQREIPTVYPAPKPEPAPRSFLFGLAISAFLVPLAWLLAKALGARPPVFTLGLPLAIAFAAMGLGIGIAFVNTWSHAFRVKAIVALLLIAWAVAATFFFLKSSWVEQIRRDLGLPGGTWQKFEAPKERNQKTPPVYSINVPGKPRETQIEIVRGWDLKAFRYSERDSHAFALTVGHGKMDFPTDDKFFAAAKDGATAAANGTLLDESNIILQRQPGREYRFKLADGATNRIVRVYRVGSQAVVAMAEGAFLPPDAREVRQFFNSLALPGVKVP